MVEIFHFLEFSAEFLLFFFFLSAAAAAAVASISFKNKLDYYFLPLLLC